MRALPTYLAASIVLLAAACGGKTLGSRSDFPADNGDGENGTAPNCFCASDGMVTGLDAGTAADATLDGSLPDDGSPDSSDDGPAPDAGGD